MTISFSVNDILITNEAYIETMSTANSSILKKQAIQTLGILRCEPSTVTAVGNITFPPRSYIKLVPIDTSHRFYNRGKGVVIWFETDAQLNNSLEKSTAYIKDKCFTKVLNTSGSPILKEQLVRQNGFDVTMQLPTVELADATTLVNAVVLGVAVEDIANGSMGGILISGAYQTDTSAFSIGSQVFLSNTPGDISITEGTEPTIVGRVLEADTPGAISFFSTMTSGGGLPGEAGPTGIQGNTGIQGAPGTSGFTALEVELLQRLANGDGQHAYFAASTVSSAPYYYGTGIFGAIDITADQPNPSVPAYQIGTGGGGRTLSTRISGATAGDRTGAKTTGSSSGFNITNRPYIFLRGSMAGVIGSPADVRYFIGLCDGGYANGVFNDTPSANCIGFQFSTSRSDTAWQFIRNDTSLVVVDTGVAHNLARGFIIDMIDDSPRTLRVAITDPFGAVAFETTVTTQIPATTLHLGMGVQTLTAAYKQIFVQEGTLINRRISI
jgi:hypothetical protein